VVPQAELTFDWWVFASATIFPSTEHEMSALKLLGGPDVSILDMVGSSGVGEVGVDVRIDVRVGEMNAGSYDSVFKGFSLVVPLAVVVCDTPFHCQNSIILMHQGVAPFCFLAQADDLCLYPWVVEAGKSHVYFSHDLRLFEVGELGVICCNWPWVVLRCSRRIGGCCI
jgi:hypothetical protein